MAKRILPTPELLKQLVSYDPNTGVFISKERVPEHFRLMESKTQFERCQNWNKRFAGKQAFNNKMNTGYVCGNILGCQITSHRAAWAIHYGEWPEKQIDHINGDREDNRIANLREVTNSENQFNTGVRSDSVSGVKGVRWRKDRNVWAARVKVNGKQYNLGHFKTQEEAIAARRTAAEQLHGEYVRHA